MKTAISAVQYPQSISVSKCINMNTPTWNNIIV